MNSARRTHLHWLVCFLCGALCSLAGQAGEWPTAKQILKESRVSAGLAVVVGASDGALRRRLSNAPGEFVIRNGLTIRNAAQFLPDLVLKWCAA